MCKKLLILITKVYPFQHLISKNSYLKWNFLFTIIYLIIFVNNWLSTKDFILITYILVILLSPIYIYQYLKEESSLWDILLCINQLFIILIGLGFIIYFTNN